MSQQYPYDFETLFWLLVIALLCYRCCSSQEERDARFLQAISGSDHDQSIELSAVVIGDEDGTRETNAQYDIGSICDGCGIHTQRCFLQHRDGAWSQPKNGGVSFKVSPRKLSFCQESISNSFRDGSSVFHHRPGIQKLCACFHSERGYGLRLMALNNRTLFNAIKSGADEVLVTIVSKPRDWSRRFTGTAPFQCVKVRGLGETDAFISARDWEFDAESIAIEGFWLEAGADALRLPAEAFPGDGRRSVCFVVLEVRELIAPNKDSFYDLLKDLSPELHIRAVPGARSCARVRVSEDDAPLVCSMAKALAKRMDKNVRKVRCIEIPELRQ